MLKPLWISSLVALSFLYSAQAAAPLKNKPKLVIVISIDQFRTDYLTRFEHQFTGGFKTLLEKGAYYAKAETSIALNVTGPGHTTILTGSLPYLNGIFANRVFDRTLNREVYCTEDLGARMLPVDATKKIDDKPESGRSPQRLLVTTVGDEMKNAWGNQSLVASVALKDRTAVLMGGHRADLAAWYNDTAGTWVSTTYYVKEGKFPEWLVKWNAFDYLGKKVPKEWNLLLPKSEYWLSTPHTDDMVSDGKGLGKQFPHPIKNTRAMAVSPWGSTYVLDTALETIKNMKLGADNVPDLLAVGLSAFDNLGHNYGPLTEELQDATLRLDRDLGEFFKEVAKLVPGGLDNTLIVLTADHGVQVTPNQARTIKLPGDWYYPLRIREELNAIVKNKFGFSKPAIAYYGESQIYLDREVLKDKNKEVDEVAMYIADYLREKPYLAAAYTKTDLLKGRVALNDVSRKLMNTVHAERSGDVIVAARPGFLEDVGDYSGRGTDHETSTVHEAAIPIVLMGPRIAAGKRYELVHHIDIAPTISALLGIIAPSGSEGQVLSSCLKK